MRLLSIPAELAGKRLDHALEKLCPDLSRSRLQKLVRRGALSCDGRKVLRSNIRVQSGEEFLFDVAPSASPVESSTGLQGEAGGSAPGEMVLPMAHRDEDLLVLVKPAGVLTHPVDGEHGRGASLSVGEWAARNFGPLPDGVDCAFPGVVHRLDRGTSGLILIALTELALSALKTAFRERRVEKRYLAWVSGVRLADEFEIDLPISPGTRDRMLVDRSGGKPALTRFRVLQRTLDHSLVECRPHTGRRHQIRVHLAAAGAGILGDRAYGPPPETWPPGVERPLLHAAGLSLAHPRTGKALAFESKPPADFQAASNPG